MNIAGQRPWLVNICGAKCAGGLMPFRIPFAGKQEVTGLQESIGSGFALLAFVATGFTVAAALALGRKPKSSLVAAKTREAVPVTLLKPLHLAEPGLEEAEANATQEKAAMR